MDEYGRIGWSGPGLMRMPVRPKSSKRWPLAGAAAVFCATLVLGGTMFLPDDTEDAQPGGLLHVDTVSRSAPVPLELPAPAALRDPAKPPVSHLIRPPLRLTDTSARDHDPGAQTRKVLAGFDYPAHAGDPLYDLLVRALAEGRTDAYIDALLNAAYTGGKIHPPAGLVTPDGGFDTGRLLSAFLTRETG